MGTNHNISNCCTPDTPACNCNQAQGLSILGSVPHQNKGQDDVCCGPSPGPRSSTMEKPGYNLCSFVEDFIDENNQSIPRVKTKLDRVDITGTVKVRIGIGRENYKVTPGLYAVGNANPQSPVFVTANYKLTFDALRKELHHLDAWILVVDTRGINVWCAAGKGTFSTQEVIRSVDSANLENIVDHRRLILPQLAAPAVNGKHVKKGCGFEVIWGPVRAVDIKPFLENGMNATAAMRTVSFSFSERVVLIPVELSNLKKYLLWCLLIIFITSGIGPDLFSVQTAMGRGFLGILAVILGIMAGAVVTPALLPWIPGAAFAIKGGLTGIGLGLIGCIVFWANSTFFDLVALLLMMVAISSFLAMNFTGSTPFTSPSGVEKEMRAFIPLQLTMVCLALMIWLGAPFLKLIS